MLTGHLSHRLANKSLLSDNFFTAARLQNYRKALRYTSLILP